MEAPSLKMPVACVPVIMSALALCLVIQQIIFHGVGRQADEGAAAHIFQLLMVVQVPIVVFFVGRWFSRAPMATLRILAVQVCAALLAFSAVFLMEGGI